MSKFLKDRTAFLSFSMYARSEDNKHPRDLIDLVTNKVDYVWKAQTMFDAITVYFLFESSEERDEFVANIPEGWQYAKVIDEEQPAIDHYTDYEGHDRSGCWMCEKSSNSVEDQS